MAEKNDPITPMMRQYKETKEKYPDAILFYRLGDFYEMFFEDAKLASSLLQIVLTKRGSKGASGTGVEVPMCGIPYHSALNYITKLIKLGYKVAICEQVEDPKLAKGLVKREVVKLITPGTVLEDSILSRKSNNFLAAVFISGKKAGLAFADVSTGEFLVSEIPGEENRDRILEELSRFNPAELLLPSSFEISEPRLVNSLKESKALLNFIEDYYFDRISAEKSLKKHFKVGSLEGFGLAGMEAAIPAA
ncbi:MAG: DNA mismatch repair protein MutS, partial [Candidatus Firestonebacteria bacterium]